MCVNRFVSTEEKKSQGARRDNEVLIQRSKDEGLTVPYRIIDNPSKLSPDDWYLVAFISLFNFLMMDDLIV